MELKLSNLFNSISLEIDVPDAGTVVRCFMSGGFFIRRKGLQVSVVQDFLNLMRMSSTGKKNIILANLHSKLDAIPRYNPEDDIPF